MKDSSGTGALFRVLLFAAVAALAGGLLSIPRDTPPDLIPVKPPDKRALMPRFVWPSVSGQKWSLEEHRGKIIFVNFWATWCAPCRKETPDLVRVYEKYRGNEVAFAGIAMDAAPEKVVPAFAARYRIEYPILLPPGDSTLAGSVESIPASFLIDRRGRVARAWVGIVHESELSKNIDELLAEGVIIQ